MLQCLFYRVFVGMALSGPVHRKSFVGCDLTAPKSSALRHFSITLGHRQIPM